MDVINRIDYWVYFNDFNQHDSYDATNDWELTQVSGGGSCALVTDASNYFGMIQLDCPADADGPVIQLMNVGLPSCAEAVAGTSAATEFVMGCRYRLLDAGASSHFVGFAENHDTSAVLPIASDNHVGFHEADPDTTSATVNFRYSGTTYAAADTDGSFTLEDNTWVNVVVTVNGTQAVAGYAMKEHATTGFDWKLIGSGETTTAINDVLIPTIALTGSGTGDDMDVDYIWVAIKRNLTRLDDGQDA
jgi:hypothetical protein